MHVRLRSHCRRSSETLLCFSTLLVVTLSHLTSPLLMPVSLMTLNIVSSSLLCSTLGSNPTLPHTGRWWVRGNPSSLIACSLLQEHGRRATAFASRLEALGATVAYPGLPSHPQHALMLAQANEGYGLGGLIGMDLGSSARANAVSPMCASISS